MLWELLGQAGVPATLWGLFRDCRRLPDGLRGEPSPPAGESFLGENSPSSVLETSALSGNPKLAVLIHPVHRTHLNVLLLEWTNHPSNSYSRGEKGQKVGWLETPKGLSTPLLPSEAQRCWVRGGRSVITHWQNSADRLAVSINACHLPSLLCTKLSWVSAAGPVLWKPLNGHPDFASRGTLGVPSTGILSLLPLTRLQILIMYNNFQAFYWVTKNKTKQNLPFVWEKNSSLQKTVNLDFSDNVRFYMNGGNQTKGLHLISSGWRGNYYLPK